MSINYQNYDYVLLDLDGTILTDNEGIKFRREALTELRKITALGKRIGIITNQGGPVTRLLSGWDKLPTPELVAQRVGTFLDGLEKVVPGIDWVFVICVAATDKAVAKYGEEATDNAADTAMLEILDILRNNLPTLYRRTIGNKFDKIYVSSLPEERKPNIDALRAAQILLRRTSAQMKTDRVVYIGDMDSDRQFAKNAGIDYVDVNDWVSE